MVSIQDAKKHLALDLRNGQGFQGVAVRNDALVVYARPGSPFLNNLKGSYEGFPVQVEIMGGVFTF